MKTTTGAKVKLGIFVFVGILLLCTGIYYIGRSKNMFGTTFRLYGIFTHVGGLQVGNNIRFSGINVGTVDAISIIGDTTVRVDMIIESHVRKFIKKDSKAIIGSEGLMGNKIINILPGSAKESIGTNDGIKTLKPIDTDIIFADLRETVENSKKISGDLSKIFNNISQGKGTIGTLLVDTSFAMNLKQTMRNINRGTAGFEKTLNSIKSGTDGFNDNMDAVKNSFLFRGYFKKKEKREKKQEEEELKKQEKEQKKEEPEKK